MFDAEAKDLGESGMTNRADLITLCRQIDSTIRLVMRLAASLPMRLAGRLRASPR
jgi:hypothetical protein